MKHLLTLKDRTQQEIQEILDLGIEIKDRPDRFSRALEGKILLMIFEKPSLRTRMSFEAGMVKLGGQAINYGTENSPMSSGKETLEDTISVASRFVDGIMARVYKHSDLDKMIEFSQVPVINGLSDFSHPCQILADLLTIKEKKALLEGLTLCYLGDANNNVTHSLLYGCAIMGINIRVGCPQGEEFAPLPKVIEEAEGLAKISGAKISVYHNAQEAVTDVDAVYTDSWMSYHIDQSQEEARVATLMPFQVNDAVMRAAKSDAIFMNCLPALRGYEQTASVIDGPASVVFDQAENRMYAQNAILLKLIQ